MSIDNLILMWNRSDDVDRREGMLAYSRYRQLMVEIAECYDTPLHLTVAAFVALSPNNDYVGNLRSLISLLQGVRQGNSVNQIVSSSYGHCKRRAYGYLTGQPLDFKGPKINAFYRNILDPSDPTPVTVDGHIVGCYRNSTATMKKLIIRRNEYETIASDVRTLAGDLSLIPNQLQAILWFTRKRVLQVKYNGQLRFDQDLTDLWNTKVQIQDIRPFPLSPSKAKPPESSDNQSALI